MCMCVSVCISVCLRVFISVWVLISVRERERETDPCWHVGVGRGVLVVSPDGLHRQPAASSLITLKHLTCLTVTLSQTSPLDHKPEILHNHCNTSTSQRNIIYNTINHRWTSLKHYKIAEIWHRPIYSSALQNNSETLHYHWNMKISFSTFQ